MAKPKILLVDADEKSLSMMTISLKKAGYNVTVARNGDDAWELVRTSQPDLIISDTKMPKMDGFTFCRKVKDDAVAKLLPFIFLTREKSVDEKIRGLELGVDDYLTKPIYLKEVLARVKLLLERREKDRVEYVAPETQFSGSLLDMGVVDLIQTMEMGQKTGMVHLTRANIQGWVAFDRGRVIHAEAGSTVGENGIYKLLLWNDGAFRIDFRSIHDIKPTVSISTQGLIMEGMRRIDELVRIKEQLPPLDSLLAIDSQMILEEHPDQFPEKIENILAEFTGKNTLQQIVDKLSYDDLEIMEIIAKLYFQGFLMPVIAEPGGSAVFADDGADDEKGALFELAPPEEETDSGSVPVTKGAEPKRPAKTAPPPPPKPPEVRAEAPVEPADESEDVEFNVDVDEGFADEANEEETPAQAKPQKAKPKQGKVIYLKGAGTAAGTGAAATALMPETAEAKPTPEAAPEIEPSLDILPVKNTPPAPPAQAAPTVAPPAQKNPAPPPRKPAAPPPTPPAAAPPKVTAQPPAPRSRPPAPDLPYRAPRIDTALFDDIPLTDEQPAAAARIESPKPATPSKRGVIAAVIGALLLLGAGGAWFVMQPGKDAGAIVFRDATLKLAGEELDLYKGASLSMNLDTPVGYRRAIQGFEALVGRMDGWADGTDQEIILSKLILSYARLGAVEEDAPPIVKANELAAGYLSERPNSAYLLLASAEAKARAGSRVEAQALLNRLGNQADEFYLYNFTVGLTRMLDGSVPELAIVALRKSVDQNPDFTLGHYELGRAFEVSRRTADATTQYRKVTELSPNHAAALYRLATLSEKNGEADEALRMVRTAVAVNEEFLPARLLLAHLLHGSRQATDALPHLRTIFDLGRPGRDDDLLLSARKLMGSIAVDAGDTEQARREFELALQIAPNDGEAQSALARLASPAPSVVTPPKPMPAAPVVAARVSPPHPAQTRPAQARPAPAASGVRAEDVATAKKALEEGRMLYQRGYLKNAAARLQQATQLTPNDDAAWALLGQTYIDLEENQKALAALQKAISINPRNAEAHVNLGGLYDTLGDTRRATDQYRTYLRLDPNGRFATDIRKLLATR